MSTDNQFPVNADDNEISVSNFQTSNGQQLRIGDCVCLLPADPNDELYIATVEKLYRDDNGKRLIQIRWYYRYKDLQHEPPSNPAEGEIYYTNYFDCQLVESVARHCKIVSKEEYLRLNEGPRRLDQEEIYFCEFAYSAEKASFTRIDGSDSNLHRCFLKSNAFDGGKSCNVSMKDLVNGLVDLEKSIPTEAISACWTDKSLGWTSKTNESKTIKDIAGSLLELEDGMQLILSSADEDPKWCRSAWRNAIAGNQTHESLLQNIKLLRDYVHQRSNSPSPSCRFVLGNEMMTTSCDTNNNNAHQYQTKLMKRKRNFMDPIKRDSDFDLHGQPHDQNERLPALPQDFVSEDLTNEISEKYAGLIKVGSVYEIDHKCLPPKSPIHLKSIRAVMVSEKTKVNVSVQFPSNLSLRKFFRKELCEVKRGHSRQLTQIGTHPELDEQFVMGPRVAERVLFRIISCTEYAHQRHLESFWLLPTALNKNADLADSPKSQGYDVSGSNHIKLDMYDTIKQNLKAGNLLPPPQVKTAEGEKSCAPIKWGIRRKVSFSGRHRSGPNPNLHENGNKMLEIFDDQETKSEEDVSPAPARKKGSVKRREGDECKKISGDKSSILKLPKDMQGRWSTERYKAAQLKLLDIMHEKGAAPGRPILRPALREEARKHIGDTGLLDHLLKHMTDTVVTNGERFRRRHNADGAMEYWLEGAGLMEIRKLAGIEDPSWIPPPGWKPGDKLPIHGFGMTPSEAQEMNQLKQDVQILKSQLRSVFSVKAANLSPSRGHNDAYPADSDIRTDGADGILNEKLKDIKIEITSLRRDLESIRSKATQSADTPIQGGKMSRCNILERVDKLESDTHKSLQEVNNNYKRMAAEKQRLEDQLADASKIIAKMQEDAIHVMKFITKSKENWVFNSSISSKPLATIAGEIQVSEPSQMPTSSVFSATGYLPCTSDMPRTNGAAEQACTGFRVCKPKGTFMWPNMANKKLCNRLQIEDILLPPLTAAAPSSTSPSIGECSSQSSWLGLAPPASTTSPRRPYP